MLIPRPVLDAIAAGDAHLAFRRWDRPRVLPGTRLRTVVGVLEVVAVTEVDPAAVTAADAAAALSTVEKATAERDGRPLWRIELRHAGADPRGALRETVPDAAELAGVAAKLADVDRRSKHGPWTRAALDIIAAQPARRAPELAAELGRETLPFKRDVRVLKELGLTESLPVGYRLSPRGEVFLTYLRDTAAG